ncbi:pentatricopeptide repeat-containing protein At2g13600-like [Selaginella moellendorffii]|uniref:pentatricopeptide repeat-containing protein At2g13600-like n=1 Tax=Selaginella moellendorffii TaxID=88036 RepID=UPI000D1CFFC0|nr:pentatricopeptide repeat-containing protein At2g13600-like [Selaginella moellendorffii]|eukprot:XP_024539408.1 pentatricopeptide repeat-containing protein At2g13600-like [Selaginella moellendorffii]
MNEQIEELLGAPDSATYAALLQRFGAAKRLAEGQRVHFHICERGYDGDTFLGNLIAQMYGRCGEASQARRAFDRIKRPDLFSWNIMLQAYSQCGEIDNAQLVFDSMPEKNVISWNAMLSAFSRHGMVTEAEELFDRLPDRNTVSWNAMLSAYATNGHLEKAKLFFGLIPFPLKNVVTWNAMVAAFAQSGRKIDALAMFWAMNVEGVKANAVTFISVLEACVDLAVGKMLHAVILNAGLDSDFKVKNALLNMHGKCGDVDGAKRLFDGLSNPNVISWTAMIGAYVQSAHLDQAIAMFSGAPEKSVVTWNTVIAGYAQNGHPNDAILVFKTMDLEGEAPNSVSFVCVLNACSNIPSLSQIKTIHEVAIECNLHKTTAVATALVTTYGKCGSVEKAWSSFIDMPRKDLVAWSAMVRTYAQNGHTARTLETFHSMLQHGIQPDDVVLVSVLAACSHAGELHLGLQCFRSLTGDYGHKIPCKDHYLCLVDLVCRSGDLGSTVSLIEAVELEAGVSIFQTTGNLGEIQFEFETAA